MKNIFLKNTIIIIFLIFGVACLEVMSRYKLFGLKAFKKEFYETKYSLYESEILRGSVKRCEEFNGFFIPNQEDTFMGNKIFTNNYGMIDKNYNIKKPKKNFRISMVSGSILMGWGIDQEYNISAQVEKILNSNKEFLTTLKSKEIEILNHSTFALINCMDKLFVHARAFDPDLILYLIGTNQRYDDKRLEVHLKILNEIAEKFRKPIFIVSLTKEFSISDKITSSNLFNLGSLRIKYSLLEQVFPGDIHPNEEVSVIMANDLANLLRKEILNLNPKIFKLNQKNIPILTDHNFVYGPVKETSIKNRSWLVKRIEIKYNRIKKDLIKKLKNLNSNYASLLNFSFGD